MSRGSPETRRRERVLKRAGNNYSPETLQLRRQWLEETCRTSIPHIANHRLNGDQLRGNIENLIGAAQVPIGIAGPLKIHGQHAQGTFFVPLATTEGALVESYTRGMLTLSLSGGAHVRILKDVMHITPAFLFASFVEGAEFCRWAESRYPDIRAQAESTTRHGRLLRLESQLLGRYALLKFIYDCQDAMGLNMINISTDAACRWIREEYTRVGHATPEYYLRSNFSADKKASLSNFVNGYGKEALVECRIPRKVVTRVLHTSPQDVSAFSRVCALAGMKSGIHGAHAHLANGLAALYIACGQDVAQIVNSAAGILELDVTKDGDLHATLHLPNLVLGTIGGGTGLPTQRECLGIMDCHGANRALKFAEIVAATLLAGEISICAALTNGDFVRAHARQRQLTKIS